MEGSTKARTRRIRNRAKENSYGPTEGSTQAVGGTASSTAKESITTSTEKSNRECGTTEKGSTGKIKLLYSSSSSSSSIILYNSSCSSSQINDIYDHILLFLYIYNPQTYLSQSSPT